MTDTPKCEKCGLEITTGMMPALCQYGRECVMWPHTEPYGDTGPELLMAKFWMDNACEQIGLQIADRKRLERQLAALVAYAEGLKDAAISLLDGASEVQDNGLRYVTPGDLDALRAALQSPSQFSSPPEGWKLVPVEPTRGMIEAGNKVAGFALHSKWTAMLAAVPAPLAKEGEGQACPSCGWKRDGKNLGCMVLDEREAARAARQFLTEAYIHFKSFPGGTDGDGMKLLERADTALGRIAP